jgi:hypothetical protein
MKFAKIKEKIKNGDQYFLFNMKPDKPYLLVKGKTKSECKAELKKKVIKNPEKYRDTKCILMYFEFRKPDNRFTVGDLLVKVHRYKITKELAFEGEERSFGYVYFEKEFLEEEGFSYTYLRNISYLIKLKKITFFALGQPGYEEKEGQIRQALMYYEKLKNKSSK